jgi:hypothetical protein
MDNPPVPFNPSAAGGDSHGRIIEALERVLADIPASGATPTDEPDSAAK